MKKSLTCSNSGEGRRHQQNNEETGVVVAVVTEAVRERNQNEGSENHEQ